MVNFDRKFKGSPYDTAGMPLGAETVDYDKKDDVAQSTVKDKYIEPLPLFSDSDEFQEKHIKRRKYNEALNNTAIQLPGHKVHKDHEDDLGTGIPELTDPPKRVDLGDTNEKREAIVEDSEKKDIAVPELPKVAKEEEVKDVKEKADKKEEDNSNPDDLLALLKETDNDGK